MELRPHQFRRRDAFFSSTCRGIWMESSRPKDRVSSAEGRVLLPALLHTPPTPREGRLCIYLRDFLLAQHRSASLSKNLLSKVCSASFDRGPISKSLSKFAQRKLTVG